MSETHCQAALRNLPSLGERLPWEAGGRCRREGSPVAQLALPLEGVKWGFIFTLCKMKTVFSGGDGKEMFGEKLCLAAGLLR